MADATKFEFGGVDTDVAVNYKHISVGGLDYILIVQVAQINLRRGISPILPTALYGLPASLRIRALFGNCLPAQRGYLGQYLLPRVRMQ